MIKNAKDVTLDQLSGTLPNVGAALLEWFQKMTFTRIVKTVVNFKVVETETDYSFRGVIQPASAQTIRQMPEGQRDWRWHQLHAETSLVLNPDEVVTYLGVKYRVKDKTDYTAYGYVQYTLHEDFA